MTITLKTKPVAINRKYYVVRGRNILSTEYRDTKAALQLETRSQWRSSPLATTLAVNILLYFGDRRRRDIDAYLKVLLDAMTGIVYEDDSQVEELHVFKMVDLENPRTEITVVWNALQ